MSIPQIEIPKDRLAEFCQRHHIHKLSLFGSVLRDDFRPGSDIDVLVEFEPGHVPGLAFFSLQDELSTILGYPVGLNTPKMLGQHYRNQVLKEAKSQYVQA
ncbi:MAG: nucleotidyltransferase family protein [Chloroflexi bacterium]|nr:nucleotidyltransferase family protein [Chloroflexota bacterium]